MSEIIKAMVMSAGVGSRLEPLTKTVPKPLVPIANKPDLEEVDDVVKEAIEFVYAETLTDVLDTALVKK